MKTISSLIIFFAFLSLLTSRDLELDLQGYYRFNQHFLDESPNLTNNRSLMEDQIQLLCNLQLVDIKKLIETPFSEIKINPKPIKETFEVISNTIDINNLNYAIYDTKGRLLKSGIINPSISIDEFDAGFYILQILKEEQTIAIKQLIKIN